MMTSDAHDDGDAPGRRHQQEAQEEAAEDHALLSRHSEEAPRLPNNYSVIAIARSAMRSRAESFSVSLLSWPQAARMSRPRGVRTGDE